MHSPRGSGASVRDLTGEDDQVLLWVNGSTALDTQARTAIKAALKEAGINVVQEKLFAAGSRSLNGSAAVHSAPRLALLVSTVAGTEEGLEELLAEDAGPNSLFATFDDCFTISSDPAAINSLFPPRQEADLSAASTSESDLVTDHERRVFTFVNEELDQEESQAESTQNDVEEEEEDEVAEQLLSISKSPLAKLRKPLGQSMPAWIEATGSLASERIFSRSPSSTGLGSGKAGSAVKTRRSPSSLGAPSIEPRLSKAAALRMGIELSEKRSKSSEVDENGDPIEPSRKEDVLVPGMTRRAVTPPRSLAKPSVTPRQNRASALRTTVGGTDMRGRAIRPATIRRESVGTSERSAPFIGLPGFAKQKKVMPPSPARNDSTDTPGLNRAALLRQSSADGHLSPIRQPSQPRKAMTTAERAAAFSIVHRRNSQDRSSSIASTSASNVGSVRSSSSSRPLLSREASEDFFSGSRAQAAEQSARSPARSPSITPRVNKAAELRLAAQRAAKA